MLDNPITAPQIAALMRMRFTGVETDKQDAASNGGLGQKVAWQHRMQSIAVSHTSATPLADKSKPRRNGIENAQYNNIAKSIVSHCCRNAERG